MRGVDLREVGRGVDVSIGREGRWGVERVRDERPTGMYQVPVIVQLCLFTNSLSHQYVPPFSATAAVEERFVVRTLIGFLLLPAFFPF